MGHVMLTSWPIRTVPTPFSMRLTCQSKRRRFRPNPAVRTAGGTSTKRSFVRLRSGGRFVSRIRQQRQYDRCQIRRHKLVRLGGKMSRPF